MNNFRDIFKTKSNIYGEAFFAKKLHQRCLTGVLNMPLYLFLNPFVPNETFLYTLKTSENGKVFCFSGVQKGCIGSK